MTDVVSPADARTPNVARMYDYTLGGKENFAVDRAAAEQVFAAIPEAREGARQNRAFLGRVVEYLAGEVGIRQFLDIGSGLPTQRNVHEVAHGVAPDARVVYVDNDPVVCVHGRALLMGGGNVAVVQADLRRPEQIVDDPATRRLIDFSQPVALLLVAVLHFVNDEADPRGSVARLRDELASGSYLVLSHMLDAEDRHAESAMVKEVYSRGGTGMFPRTKDEVMRFFEGFELLESSRFIPPELIARFAKLGWGGVGRKP